MRALLVSLGIVGLLAGPAFACEQPPPPPPTPPVATFHPDVVLTAVCGDLHFYEANNQVPTRTTFQIIVNGRIADTTTVAAFGTVEGDITKHVGDKLNVVVRTIGISQDQPPAPMVETILGPALITAAC